MGEQDDLGNYVFPSATYEYAVRFNLSFGSHCFSCFCISFSLNGKTKLKISFKVL